MFNGRYYCSLRGYETSTRIRTEKSLPAPTSEIFPTELEEHSGLEITIRECLDYLELRATARVSG